MVSQVALVVSNLPANSGDAREARSPGEENGNPLQYSCLENPMDGGAWWAAVHGVAKSRTWLSHFTTLLREASSVPGLGRSSGAGNGNPLQYSCLENPVDRGTWWSPEGESDTTEWLSIVQVHYGILQLETFPQNRLPAYILHWFFCFVFPYFDFTVTFCFYHLSFLFCYILA